MKNHYQKYIHIYKKFYKKHRKKLLKISRRYYYKNREHYLLWHKKWRKRYKKYIKEYRKIYYWEHREHSLEYNKKYCQNHKQQKRLNGFEWRKNNPNYYNKHRKSRRKTDFNFRILDSLRSQLYIVLQGNRKNKTTVKLVGCSIEFLKQWLEKKFKSGMTWKNYGKGDKKWVIDHIKPCVSFDLSKSREQHKCFHYTNLQPLWWKDNLTKGKNE